MDILKQICALHPVGRTTAADLVKSYKQNRPHFMTLDHGTQVSITWSKLGRLTRAADTPADTTFLAFIDPGLLPVSACPATPVVHPGPSIVPEIHRPPSPTTSTVAVDEPIAPTPPTIFTKAVYHTTPPIVVDPVQMQFPLNAETLQPLGPDERAVLDADAALIRATHATLGDGIVNYSDDLTSSQEPVGLYCPFCDTELPGKQYSDALLAILNSPMIQVHTVCDPVGNNPNRRRLLIGPNVYSGFCAQHVLEELTPIAKSHGWPYPPDFSTLPQRIKDKRGFLDAVIIRTTTGVNLSPFYSNLLAMDNRKRLDRSFDVISAG